MPPSVPFDPAQHITDVTRRHFFSRCAVGLGGIALAFISVGKQLLFFSPTFVMLILTPLLFLMTGAFALGFAKRG